MQYTQRIYLGIPHGPMKNQQIVHGVILHLGFVSETIKTNVTNSTYSTVITNSKERIIASYGKKNCQHKSTRGSDRGKVNYMSPSCGIRRNFELKTNLNFPPRQRCIMVEKRRTINFSCTKILYFMKTFSFYLIIVSIYFAGRNGLLKDKYQLGRKTWTSSATSLITVIPFELYLYKLFVLNITCKF